MKEENEENKCENSEDTICCKKESTDTENLKPASVSVQTSTDDLLPPQCRPENPKEGVPGSKGKQGCCGGTFSCHYSNFVEKRTKVTDAQKLEVLEKQQMLMDQMQELEADEVVFMGS